MAIQPSARVRGAVPRRPARLDATRDAPERPINGGAPTVARVDGAEVPTLGVEEEWHVLDGATGLLCPQAPLLLERLARAPGAPGAVGAG